ncbi:TGF-beta-activated kinase 1 and MAP3K7-binding protein 1-like [Lytechinus pictus]|uniref:TGF-beta-activated kinase 1 and MAP3K7-binding protein 1-like n=1 Tax=Lytechinus pictus TaxID=7653 RepID=UPI0030BA1667
MTSRTPRRTTPSIVSQHSQGSLQSWTDDLPVCRHSGIGYSNNQVYRQDGARSEDHEFEDKFFHFRTEQDDYLYAIFDGYDGVYAPGFAHQGLPAELLLGQLSGVHDDAEVKRILQRAFVTVERGLFESLDHVVAERANLKLSLPDGVSDYELYQKYPMEMEKFQSMTADISGGTSAIVTLIHDNKLFVANVGDSRALLCTLEPDNTTKVRQLSVDHTTNNHDELLRLSQLGLDTDTLQSNKLLGDKMATRTIGNHTVKGGYKENTLLCQASSEPILAEPDIIGGLDVSNMTGFLMMYSNGLSQSLIEATDTSQANLDLAFMAMSEFEVQATLSGVAQAVVDKVVRKHHDTYLSEGGRMANCQKRDDITLIVRNFNFPLGSRMSSPCGAAPYNPAPIPFSTPIPQGGSQPPRLTITSANRTRTDSQSSLSMMTPLYVEVDNNNVSPINQQRSPLGQFVGDLTPQPGIPQPYFGDDMQHTPRPPSNEGEEEEDKGGETENTRMSSSTDSTNQSSTEESQRVFDFNRHDETKAKVDENGMIDPYVDFTDFFTAYKAVCPDPAMASS